MPESSAAPVGRSPLRYIAQIQVTKTKAPVSTVGCQANQPVGNHFILRTLSGLVSVAGFAHPEGIARQLDRYSTFPNGLSGHLATLRWPHHFFAEDS